MYDASATWSGFNYQGKVALFYALKCINDLYENEESKDLSSYSLMLERNEDFEILKNNESLSLHQVKAYNEHQFSKYSDAILEMITGHRGYRSKIYLHTIKTISYSGKGLFSDRIKEEIQKVIERYDAPNDNKPDYIREAITGKSTKQDSTALDKKSKIIRNNLVPDLDEHQIIEFFKNIYNDNSDDAVYKRILRYPYANEQLSCSLKEIKSYIIEELRRLHTNIGKHFDSTQGDRAFFSFLGLLDEHIIERHKMLNNGEFLSLDFLKIKEFAIRDYQNFTEDYIAFEFKNILMDQMYDFCGDKDLCNRENINNCTNENNCNLKYAFKKLANLSSLELFALYKNQSPHKDLENPKGVINALKAEPDAIPHTLYVILYALNNKAVQSHTEVFLYREPSGSRYLLPSTIPYGTPTSLSKNILKNHRRLSTLPDVTDIVTVNNKVDNLFRFTEKHIDDIDLSDYCDGLVNSDQERIKDLYSSLKVILLSDAEEIINVD